ncbi:MBOAT family protein [Verticillium dahliae]
MASTATDTHTNGHTNTPVHEHVLRPRPRKAVHSQLSTVSNVSETSSTGDASSYRSALAESGMTRHTHGSPQCAPANVCSGRSTPVPADAPPSVKSISSAKKTARAEQRRRIFPTIEYASRVSHFDPNSDYRDFHGFFNLFWIGLAIMAITTMLRNIKDTGHPMRVQIWYLFTIKTWHLAIADFLMVATTAVSVLMHRVFRAAPANGPLTWKTGGMAIQSLYQVGWLAVWVAVPFWLEWTWTAQVFFLLHTMVLLMKMHSWAFYNGHLCETEKRLRALDNPSGANRDPAYLYPTSEDPLRDQAPKSPKQAKPSEKHDDTNGSSKKRTASSGSSELKPADALLRTGGHESDEEVSDLREDLARELTSPMGNIAYPRNLTWANYLDYLLCPTLCYELEYPRAPNRDWTSLISKIVAVFGCIFLLTIISEEFILPILIESSLRLNPPMAPGILPPSATERLLILAETVSWLLFPFMLTFLLVFLVIFEYALGACAEMTRFGDRQFYNDWWNSTDWMEFSREWNIPVYSFLRRHVYSASRPHIGRMRATVITFLISAIGHEIVMACITKKLRGYGFVCQMLQLPIVMLQRTKLVRGKKTLNNVMFWVSMVMGLSMICSLYVLV